MSTTEVESQPVAGTEPGFVAAPWRPRNPFELLRDTWDYRGLFLRLGLRQIVKGYVGLKLGRTWLMLRPVAEVFGMALLFGSVLGTPSNGVPYLLGLLLVMIPWMMFERTVFWATRSFDIYRKAAGRLALPQLLIPTVAMAPAFINTAIILVIAALTGVYYVLADGSTGLDLATSEFLLAPAAVALALLIGWGVSLWTATLNGLARDVRLVVQFFLPVWFFVTPVVYPVSKLPDKWQFLATINPMTAPIEMFREGVLANPSSLTSVQLTVSLVFAGVVSLSGLLFLCLISPRLLRAATYIEDDEEEELLSV